MKHIVFILVISALVQFGFGQEKPLSQAEYVKILYTLPSDAGAKPALVEALRKRGIDFVLTDGLRSLTRSKGSNDEELKRALEEADRRRQNPGTVKLPSEKEAGDALRITTKNTLDALGDMPDFVVKQQIQRSVAYAGTNNFRNLDRLVVAASYRVSGEENYRVLSRNGQPQPESELKRSYEEVGGTSSTGEFVTVLATIFRPESKTRFDLIDTDLLRGRPSLVFDFSVERDRAKQVITAVGYSTDSTVSGMKGRLWIDREDARVLRIESEATEIPANFPVRTARRTIDYDWITIDEERYLMPSLSDVRLTLREKARTWETRNVIRFRDYQKYGTDVKILDEDILPEPE